MNTPSTPQSSPLKTGQPFPSFALPDQEGRTLKLSDFAGKWLVLFVYPKDDTPGCTIESRAFSGAKAQFDAANAVVLGVSEDDVASHKNFCNKYGLVVSLLADTKHELLNAMGVGQKEWKGTLYWNRTSFLIDPQGVLRKVYEGVKPEGHEREVLEDILAMSRAK